MTCVDDDLPAGGDRDDAQGRWTVASAAIQQADGCFGRGDTDGALSVIDRALDDEYAAEEVHDERVSFLLLVKARYLAEAGHADEALAVREQAIERTDDSAAAHWNQRVVAHPRLLHAVVLAEIGRPREALAEYDHIATAWADEDEPHLREGAATALRYSARLRAELGRENEADAALNHLIDRYGSDPVPSVRAEAALGMAHAAILLTRANKRKKALLRASQVLNRYRGSQNADIRAALAAAHVCKLHILLRRLRLVAYVRAVVDFMHFIGPNPELKVVAAVKTAHPKAEKLLRRARTFNS